MYVKVIGILDGDSGTRGFFPAVFAIAMRRWAMCALARTAVPPKVLKNVGFRCVGEEDDDKRKEKEKEEGRRRKEEKRKKKREEN